MKVKERENQREGEERRQREKMRERKREREMESNAERKFISICMFVYKCVLVLNGLHLYGTFLFTREHSKHFTCQSLRLPYLIAEAALSLPLGHVCVWGVGWVGRLVQCLAQGHCDT